MRGYLKDFITSHGIHDAFRGAEPCAAALDEALSGARSFDVAMGEYQRTRDEQVLPMYEFPGALDVGPSVHRGRSGPRRGLG
jgi:hypothetical protein